MRTWITSVSILLAFVALATSESLLIPKQVERLETGDVFQPNPGKKCFDVKNAENHPTNKSFCKCKDGWSTLYFDYENEDACFVQSDIESESKRFY